MEEMRNANKILLGKHEGKRPRRRWEDVLNGSYGNRFGGCG
jgi:hypothetical protein